MTQNALMRRVSILFLPPQDEHEEAAFSADPVYFTDLAIDRVLDSVLKNAESYNLRPLFRQLPKSLHVIKYRNDVLKDLSSAPLNGAAQAFCQSMAVMRRHLALADKSFNKYQAAFFSLQAMSVYCQAVAGLESAFSATPPTSDGLIEFAAAVRDYVLSKGFVDLSQETQLHQKALSEIIYTVLFDESSITVRPFSDEPDYNDVITSFFSRFQTEKKIDAEKTLEGGVWIGNIQSRILDGVAHINPEIFSALCNFTAQGQSFIDPVLTAFEREVQFYLVWIGFTDKLAKTGLIFSVAQLVDNKKIKAKNGFDLALADKLYEKGEKIITNEFYLEGQERIFVVTGPNQGGKTTFARMFGQMHYFANLGLSVPGESVCLQFFDAIFTHFEREEALTALHGKLYDDLVRIHQIIGSATADSLIVLNEIFNSTALKDAQFLANKILQKIIAIDAFGVCVTFMDELTKIGPQMVSVTSMVEPETPEKRSFHVVRRQADGLAYALSIARKYGVTYEQLKERLA